MMNYKELVSKFFKKYQRSRKSFTYLFLKFFDYNEVFERVHWTRTILWNLEEIREQNMNKIWMKMKELKVKGLENSLQYKKLGNKFFQKDKKYQLIFSILSKGIKRDIELLDRYFYNIIDKINQNLEKIQLSDDFDLYYISGNYRGLTAFDGDWEKLSRFFQRLRKVI